MRRAHHQENTGAQRKQLLVGTHLKLPIQILAPLNSIGV